VLADADGAGGMQGGATVDVEPGHRHGHRAGRGAADAGTCQPVTSGQWRRPAPQQAGRRRRMGGASR